MIRILAAALLSSAVLCIADDFDLPEMPPPAPKDVVEPSHTEKTVSTNSAADATVEKTPLKPITSLQQSAISSDYDDVPESFSAAPIEASSVTDVIFKPIPKTLNRKLNVGVYVDVKELFVNQDGTEIQITANKGKLSVKRNSKTETVATYSFKQGSKCLTMAPDKKSMPYSCFAGDFTLKANGSKITAINSIDVEEYLRGVIPYEIGKLDSSRFEALKAQAVAARTYAYKHFGSREAIGFDVYADTKDQVYKGLAGATPLTDKAVRETAGTVMTYGGEFIIAYYHSTCGGETETLATWGRPDLPYLKSEPDLRPDGTPWCNESSYSNWERKFSDKETLALFKQNAKEVKSKLTEFSSINAITITDTLKSGRILSLDVETDKGTFQVAGDKTRWLFKKNGAILPSSFFRIAHENGEWIIKGKGFGHGVGLCQMGVRARAQAGQNYKQILTHYYPGITLEKFVR